MKGFRIEWSRFVSGLSFLLLVSCSEKKQGDAGIGNHLPDATAPSGQSSLPHIYIDVEEGKKIESKEDYVHALLTIDGKEEYPSYEGQTDVKGRGNSTWELPKKPYRLKLNEAASLLGLAEYEDWVLLAEYLDGSMLYNAVPFKAGEQLGIPYTNHIIPVDLTINGDYQGVYVFTEHKEVGKNRIDIGKDGWLFEMDVYFDEDWKFKSAYYNLPIMIQFPKAKNMTEGLLDEMKSDFEALEKLVHDESFPNNDYLERFDDASFVNYMVVQELTLNQELNHPKSTYINKLAGGKYRMGIIWDFDWGYGYSISGAHYDDSTTHADAFWNSPGTGTRFFSRFMQDPHMKALFRDRWQWFRAHEYEALKDYVLEFAEKIRWSLPEDQAIWGARGSSGDMDRDVRKLLNWLDKRAEYLDNLVVAP